MEHIELVPSWEAIIPVLVHVANNGTTVQGRTDAMNELKRLARTVDEQNARIREEQAEEKYVHDMTHAYPHLNKEN